MVGLWLVGVSVVAGVFVSLTSLELVARRCLMLCDTPRLLLVVGGLVGLRLAGGSVVAGVFASLTSSELVARRCVMLCDTPRLLLVVGGFYYSMVGLRLASVCL